MIPTPAQWFRTRPNAPPDIHTHQTETGEWKVLLLLEGGIDNEADALRAAALANAEVVILTQRAHTHEEYTP